MVTYLCHPRLVRPLGFYVLYIFGEVLELLHGGAEHHDLGNVIPTTRRLHLELPMPTLLEKKNKYKTDKLKVI